MTVAAISPKSRIIEITKSQIEALKETAASMPLRRARICLHNENTDLIHEMIIAFHKDSYIPPHKHVGKSESFHIIEGEAGVVIFDDAGAIEHIVHMGEYHQGLISTYRLNDYLWHTVIPLTEILVLKEVTSGPHNPAESRFAPWAPDINDGVSCQKYMDVLRREIDDAVSKSKSNYSR